MAVANLKYAYYYVPKRAQGRSGRCARPQAGHEAHARLGAGPSPTVNGRAEGTGMQDNADHILVVQSNAVAGRESEFNDWYTSPVTDWRGAIG
jgi:hypothetical protein